MFDNLSRKPWFTASATVFSLLLSGRAAAFSVTFTASGTDTFSGGEDLAAAATFFQSGTGSDLEVTLTNTANTSNSDVQRPSNLLTALFFKITGNPGLTKLSALLDTGSTVMFAPSSPAAGSLSPSGPDVGGEWAYRDNVSSRYGISSTGLGDFGPGDRFRTDSNLQGPEDPDGMQYGITSANDDSNTGNSAVTGDNALIKNAVKFTFHVPTDFELATDVISNVSFQYGTSYAEVNLPGDGNGGGVPEPQALLLFGVGFMGLALARKRHSRKC